MDYTKEILKSLNKPIYPLSISLKTHKIFLKYSNPRYRKYSLDLIKNLCQKIQFPNSESIFYQININFKMGMGIGDWAQLPINPVKQSIKKNVDNIYHKILICSIILIILYIANPTNIKICFSKNFIEKLIAF